MVKMRCVVERITYQNPENGYCILKTKVKDYSDMVAAVGNLLEVNLEEKRYWTVSVVLNLM